MAHWLESNHWRFVIDKNGLPKVARAYRDMKLGLVGDTKATKYDEGPNLQAFAKEPVSRAGKQSKSKR